MDTGALAFTTLTSMEEWRMSYFDLEYSFVLSTMRS
jgi:hypothetical protein